MYNDVEYYYVKNLQGDIVGLVDGNGSWVVEYSYDAWGNILSVEGTLKDTLGQDNPLRYRGYFYDAETGFYYVSSRYYDPEVGRFISADKTSVLEAEPMKLTSKNLYAYCDNNPVSKKDLNGEFAIPAMAVGAVTNALSYVVSSAIMGDKIEGEGVFWAVVSGGIGVLGFKGFLAGIVIDSVYAFVSEYEGSETLGVALLSCVGTAAFSLGSTPGMMSLLKNDNYMPIVEKTMFEFYVGTANNAVVSYAASAPTNTGNSAKTKPNENWMKMNTVYNKVIFKEKQMGHAIYNPTYNKLTFKERYLREF